MLIEKVNTGNYFTNCYIVGEEEGYGAVIDPGSDAEEILQVIEDININILYIINTHAHFDHIGANLEVKKETGAEILIHEQEQEFLVNPGKNLSELMGNLEITSSKADRLLKAGEKIEIGKIILEVFHTPGHSPGGISLYNKKENVIFSGDTIFKMGVGRTDFPGSSKEQLSKSIKEKLLCLPEKTDVYPGHGEKTTIGDFKANVWERVAF